jgi:hypothetical protein
MFYQYVPEWDFSRKDDRKAVNEPKVTLEDIENEELKDDENGSDYEDYGLNPALQYN